MRSKEDVSNARPPLGTTHQLPVYRETLMVFTICMSQLLTQAGLAQSIAPLHIIGSTFSVSTAQMTWFPASYSLTVGTFILFSGTLGDKYGHKRIFTIGWLWFALWSLVVGFSGFSGWSILFDTARAMQGIGPALLLPNALAILGQYYPPGAKKEMMFSLFGATAPGGFVLGAAFSSLLAQYVWWPWGYWILAIVCILLALLARLSLPPDHVVLASAPQQSFTKWSQVAPYLSIICGLVGMILINIAWNQAPIQGWATPYICVLLACGVGLILLFTLLHLHQVRQTGSSGGFNTEVTVTLICVGLGWASFGIWIYYLWQIFQILRNASPLLSTAWFSPVALSGLTAALVTGQIIGRLYPAFIMMIAMAAFCIGSILAATMPFHQTYWTQTFISILIMPWGMVRRRPYRTSTLLMTLGHVVPRWHYHDQ